MLIVQQKVYKIGQKNKLYYLPTDRPTYENISTLGVACISKGFPRIVLKGCKPFRVLTIPRVNSRQSTLNEALCTKTCRKPLGDESGEFPAP